MDGYIWMDGAGKNSYLNYLEFIIKDRPDYTINIIQSQLIFQNQLFNLEINMTVYYYHKISKHNIQYMYVPVLRVSGPPYYQHYYVVLVLLVSLLLLVLLLVLVLLLLLLLPILLRRSTSSTTLLLYTTSTSTTITITTRTSTTTTQPTPQEENSIGWGATQYCTIYTFAHSRK